MAKIIVTDSKATWEMVGKSANEKKIADALEKVGLGFTVEKRPIFFGPDMKRISKKYATVRTDKETEMGIVGEGYEVCQNETAFSFADYIDSKMVFTRGGLTYSGLCWVMGELPSIKILGEEYIPCLCLQNSFNGKYTLRANIIALNKANNSQFSLTLDGIASSLKVKHSSYLPSRMKQGQETLSSVTRYMDGLRKAAEKYASIKMDKKQIEQLVSVLFPIRPNMSETVKANVLAQREAFMACYDEEGNAKHRGSAWGLIRAYADYNTHTLTKNTKTGAERKFMETTLGKNTFGSFLKKLESVTGQKVA